MTLEDLLDKTCLMGLSYFDTNKDLLRQEQYAGTVKNVDEKNGISIALFEAPAAQEGTIASDKEKRVFVIPPLLTTWFKAPPGAYKNPEGKLIIDSPDFFVTWDVYKTQDKKQGDHEWWDWVPRTVPPKVN